MESDTVYIMMWINIRVCLPLTLIVFTLCCAVRLDGVPVTFYMNLLVSNLIQITAMVALMVKITEYPFNPDGLIVFGCGAVASLCFRTAIALERYFLLSWPQLHFFRQIKASVMFCVLVWIFVIVLFPVVIILEQYVFFVLFSLIPAPVFILCLTCTIKSLPAATSVSAGGKRRIIGSLVLLLVVYSVMIFPLTFYVISFYFRLFYVKSNISCSLFLLSPFMDLILFLFMCKDSIDKLLMYFCRCRIRKTEEKGSSRL